MADLAIGISKTVVNGLVDKLQSAVKEEAELLQTVQRDLVFITDEFEMMQSFLNTAYGEQIKNKVARTWVRQVRDISYDTEDSIESAVNMATKPSVFHRFLHSLFQLLPVYQVQALPLDKVVSDIKLLKDRIEEVNQRNMRYSQISSNSGEQMMQAPDATQRAMVDSFINPRDAMEELNGIRKITELITTNDPWLQVISLSGTGGNLGAISIIRKVCSIKNIRGEFDLYAWLKPMRPFNVDEFHESLLAQFMFNSNSTHDDTTIGSLLNGKTYLVVLEEVSSITDWWQIINEFTPYKNTKSRIIVSTQQLEIASLCMEQPYQASLLWEISTYHAVYAFKEPSKGIQLLNWGNNKCSVASRTDVVAASHWREDHRLCGRDKEAKKLYNEIFSAQEIKKHHVISVCGIAGVGKSFLVKTVLDHFYMMMTTSSTRKNIAMVCAPRPFDIKVFSWTLLRSFQLEINGAEDFVGKCLKHLEDHPCLVAIDDLESIEDWVSIKANLISRGCRSCIVVITREEGVARHCAMTHDAMCSIRGLEADEALRLFQTKVTETAESSNGDDVKEEVAVIINNCGRLPKLIVALGDYFNKSISIGEIVHLKSNFMYELKTRKELHSFREVLTWMHKTYQFWPQYLKKCIFYLSIFTEGSVIRRSRLVQRWIAEGYSEVTDRNSMVENTEKLLGKLVTLGMLEQSPKTPTVEGDMRMTACQVKSFFVDYIISREMEENIFLPLEVSVLQGEGSMKVQRAGQHLAVRRSWKRDKFLLDSMDLSRLRSLTVSRKWKPFFISDRMRVLRVLDLEDTNVTDDDLKQIVKQLPRLKFLSLRRCRMVYSLPDSLDELNQLQTLDIRHTNVVQLPYSIVKLCKLQYIRAGTSVPLTEESPSARSRTQRGRHGHVDACDGVRVPHGIRALMALHTLGVINLETKGSKHILKELKYLTQLRKLGLSGINQRNSKTFFNVIAGLGHLQSLSLQMHMDDDLDWLGKITLPTNLRRLKLYVLVEKFQHWKSLQSLGQIKKLQTLHLHFKTDQEIELQFSDRTNGTEWSTPNQFCELKLLKIDCNSSLHVQFADKDMVPLELLKIRCMDGSSSLKFSGLEHTGSLKHVWVKGSFGETLKQQLRQKLHQHGKTFHLNQEEPRSS